MTTTDPAEQAAQQASELVGQKIDRVKELAKAAAAEDPLSELVAAAKKAGEAATGETEEHVREAQRAAEAALKSARAETQVRRKAATDAGWSISELAQMNLAKARAPRRAKSKKSTSSAAAADGSVSSDADGAPAADASPFPADTSSPATG
jgi:serine phosphatase RsbU (regulator of sigma subunit)